MQFGDIVRLKENRSGHWVSDSEYGKCDCNGPEVEFLPEGTLFRVLNLEESGIYGTFGKLDLSYSITDIDPDEFEPL
jgi:hypothetical protein